MNKYLRRLQYNLWEKQPVGPEVTILWLMLVIIGGVIGGIIGNLIGW